MKTKRCRCSPEFKAKVAKQTHKGIKTTQQIAKEFEVHPAQASDWKKVLVENFAGVFEKGAANSSAKVLSTERNNLNASIRDLMVKLEFLTKKSKQLGL